MFALPFPPPCNTLERSAAWLDGALSDASLARLNRQLEALELRQAVVEEGENKAVRNNQIAWVKYAEETNWIYETLRAATIVINDQYFRFRLQTFVEPLQYTVYERNEKKGLEFYDWHVDSLRAVNLPQRKLSFSVQLSHPEEYEGGELKIKGLRDLTLPKTFGTIIFFPSYTYHCVTPVTRGVRRSLVGWIHGPEFS